MVLLLNHLSLRKIIRDLSFNSHLCDLNLTEHERLKLEQLKNAYLKNSTSSYGALTYSIQYTNIYIVLQPSLLTDSARACIYTVNNSFANIGSGFIKIKQLVTLFFQAGPLNHFRGSQCSNMM